MQTETRLDDLLDRWECDGSDPAVLCRECPELLPALRERISDLERLAGRFLTPGGPPTTELPPPPTPLPEALEARLRFRPERLHARGGLGEVVEAADDTLGRAVAVKFLQARHANDPVRVERFRREAAVTGRLDHPGIVPVFAAGDGPDGRPFYAMRFVRGETLHEAAAKFHAGGDPARFRSLPFRRLLGRFVAVCQAVAYAHSRGVVHRDLKPANVMLGPFGETLVVDWGLAKAAGVADGPPAAPSDGPGTMDGHGMGTFGFMSPEQAAGRWADVGPATDVFALGATLRCVVTAAGPRPLRAIADRATRAEPTGRYPSAADVAAEVERWLAGERVHADREPLADRLRRWTARHRTFVTGLAVAVGVTVVALTATAVVLGRAYERERAARADAQQSFADARAAVDESLTQLSEGSLDRVPGLQPLRLDLLKTSLKYYEAFLRRAGDDPKASLDVAVACSNIARIVTDTEKAAAALPWHARAVDHARRAATLAAADAETAYEYARLLDLAAMANVDAGSAEEALPLQREALAALDGIVAAQPEHVRALTMAARVGDNHGSALMALGRRDDALDVGKRAAAAGELLLGLVPAEDGIRLNLGAAQNNVGTVLMELGRWTEALEAFQRATATLAPLLTGPARSQSPTREPRHVAAIARRNAGACLQMVRRYPEAAAEYAAAGDLWARMAADNPQVAAYADLAGLAHADRGWLFLAQQQPAAALSEFVAGRALAEPAVGRGSVAAAVRLVGIIDGAGVALAALGRRDEAAAAFAAGRAACDAAEKRSPGSAQVRGELARHLGRRAWGCRELGRIDDAVALVRERVALEPTDPVQLEEAAKELLACAAKRPDADRESLTAEAVALLARAVDAGGQLDWAGPEFSPLAERADVRKLRGN